MYGVFFKRQTEDNGAMYWNVIEILPSYVLENRTNFPLRIRVRPEHRWESLQYALQSVAMSTLPPGPLGNPIGKWLALPNTSSAPANNNNNNNAVAHTPATIHSTTFDQHSMIMEQSVHDDEEDDTFSTISQSRNESPRPTRSRISDVGAHVAQDLLRSMSPPLTMMASPVNSPALSTMMSPTSASSSRFSFRKSFSASLEQSSILADDSASELTVAPNSKLALEVDPRETHALMAEYPPQSNHYSAPLRLHPNNGKSLTKDTFGLEI